MHAATRETACWTASTDWLRGGAVRPKLGGFLDIVADFTIYAGFVVAVAVPSARLACLGPRPSSCMCCSACCPLTQL